MASYASDVRLPPVDGDIAKMTAAAIEARVIAAREQMKATVQGGVELFERTWEGTAATSPFTFICTQYNILAEVFSSFQHIRKRFEFCVVLHHIKNVRAHTV
jgi:hypothetical protein